MNAYAPAAVLDAWLQQRLAPAAWNWSAEAVARTAAGDRQGFYLAFGLTSRKTGKADLAPTEAELAQARTARTDWDPSRWSVDQAARTRLVLALPASTPEQLLEVLDQLFAGGSVDELVALYQALPLLPHPEAHVWRAREGMRTNMKSVFCGVAHHNPYPAEQLDEGSWNQLVLKCLFIGVPLDPVLGLDRRANPALARMLLDYAHERWAAKRPVSPELWRPVGPCADAAALADLQRVLDAGTEVERQAAALALAACPLPEAKTLLAAHPDLDAAVRNGRSSWQEVAAAL